LIVRIAYYAPLKSPRHPTPSGDRQVARLLREALVDAGHDVPLVSEFSSFDRTGDPARQAALREEGQALARRLASEWLHGAADARPDLWLTYHVFYKAPDWLGPTVATALGIPYVIFEASHAAKRANGAWAIGHAAAAQAIQRAALVACPSRDDVPAIVSLRGTGAGVMHVPPFLDVAPFADARDRRMELRARMAAELDLDPAHPWLLAVAMMRPPDKLASYAALAAALARLADLEWSLVVAGDGSARGEVERALETAAPGRTRFAGRRDLPGLVPLYAACDLFVWPAVNEAYGMAMLEAQAAGLPVVSSDLRGVPDVVQHDRTGLLAPPGDVAGFAARIRELLTDPARRHDMGDAAAAYVASERGLDVARRRLDAALAAVRMAAKAA
jgi:glycosyltransferase involved in cell wall biosynthesis